MLICKVIGHVWATKKEDSLEGVQVMVAADKVGAGIGEDVLVVSGSTARRALGRDDLPVDCAIVGIIDTVEVEKESDLLEPPRPRRGRE